MLVALVGPRQAMAQYLLPASQPGNPQSVILVAGRLSYDAGGPTTLTVVEVTIPPGATVVAGDEPGPMLMYVRSGTLVLQVPRDVAASDHVRAMMGQRVVFRDGRRLRVQNPGNLPAQVVVASLTSPALAKMPARVESKGDDDMRYAPRVTAAGFALALLLAVGLSAETRHGLAQTPTASPTPPFSIDLIAHAELGPLPPGEILITVSEVVIPAGIPTRPISATRGPVVVRVTRGTLVLDATEAIITTVVPPIGPLMPEIPAPAPVTNRALASSDQVVLPQGATARITNPGPDRAVVTIISITSLESVPPGTPEASPVS
jgi:hypothetical protein